MPELSAAFGPFEQMAVMAVPEASIDEYNCLAGCKNQIRFSGQAFAVKAISVAEFEKTAAYQKFRFCVLRADTRHHAASNCGAYNIRQEPPVCRSCGFSDLASPLRELKAPYIWQSPPQPALRLRSRTGDRPAYPIPGSPISCFRFQIP